MVMLPECEPGGEHVWELIEGLCELCDGHEAFCCYVCGEVIDSVGDGKLFGLIMEEFRDE